MKKLISFILAGFLSGQALADAVKDITIANWNLQVFGAKKTDYSGENAEKNKENMQIRKDILDDYDIIFVQEIRDSSNTAFQKLCDMLPEYKHAISSRAGRSSSKEQYGVLYKGNVRIKGTKDYNPDSQNRWERPPYEVVFQIGGKYILRALNIHTKPEDVPNELKNLEKLVSDSTGNVLVCGDLNADCSYYDRKDYNYFMKWDWVISDIADTTVAKTDCAYDRFIANQDAGKEIISSGVSRDIRIEKKKISDHYPVWIKITPIDK